MIAENKNHRKYKVLGHGYEGECWCLQEGTSIMEAFDPDAIEWIAVAVFD